MVATTRSLVIRKVSGQRNAGRLYYVAELLLSAGELADRGLHDLFGESQVKVSDRPGHHRVHAGLEASSMTREDCGHAAGLMRVGFGMLVNVNEQRAIEHVAVALRHRLELADEIGELFYVPSADIAHDALSFGALVPGVMIHV